MKNLLFGILVGGMICLGGFLVGEHFVTKQTPTTTQSFGSFQPVEATPFSVAKTVLPADNTITLAGFKTPDGRNLTMAMFGYVGYGTLDPTNLSPLESVTFSGITNNANGTVTLTGVTRGNDFVSPYAASSTLAQLHLVGATFLVTNTAGYYGNEFLFANNTGTSSQAIVMSSTTPWHYDSNPVWVNFGATTLASKGYVDSAVVAGAAPITTATAGIGLLATAAQAALGTATGVFNAITYNLLLPASMATSTPGVQAVNVIPVTGTNQKLSQLFLDLTQSFSWSGLHTFTVGLIGTASSTFSATTTIAANSITNRALVLNTIPYQFPSTQGAVSTVLQNNGSGILSWNSLGLNIGTTTASTSPTISNNTSAELTFASITVPGNTLGTGNVLVWDVPVSSLICTSSTAGCSFAVKIKYGGTTVFSQTFGWNTNSATQSGTVHFRLVGNGSTSSQYEDTTFTTQISQINLTNSSASQTGFNLYQTGSSVIDSTSNQTLTMTVILTASSGNSTSMAIGAGTVTVSK